MASYWTSSEVQVPRLPAEGELELPDLLFISLVALFIPDLSAEQAEF